MVRVRLRVFAASIAFTTVVFAFALCGTVIARAQTPAAAGHAAPQEQELPTGMNLTPTAAQGAHYMLLRPGIPGHPDFAASDAVSTALSPDGKTLLILTSGYNRVYDAQGKIATPQVSDYAFVYDVVANPPKLLQALPLHRAFDGIAWSPAGDAFYVSGGEDDSMLVFERTGAQWSEAKPAIALGHTAGLGIEQKPVVAGVAVTPSGRTLIAVNYENDSISVVDLSSPAAQRKVAELDLRPGKSDPSQSGVPGGEYPYWVAIASETKAYVSSLRDREIVVVGLGAAPRVVSRIHVEGSPNKMILNREATRLFVALDNSDSVAEVDTATDRVIGQFSVTAPPAIFANREHFKGSNPNSLALSPDEHTLYVTDGGTNALAVVRLTGDTGEVAGLIPTGWYPHSVSVSADGRRLYVVNGKSVAGPNPKGCRTQMATSGPQLIACRGKNQYILQLTRAGLLSLPTPGATELAQLTAQVARNDHFRVAAAWEQGLTSEFLHEHIHHVIYIIKENRSYDQVLGDLGRGDGDPALTLFPDALTPNHHQIARQFVTLDHFDASGEVSGDGWNWSTAARATDALEKALPPNYALLGPQYDYEGTNRGVNVGIADATVRKAADPRTPADPDLLPGTADAFAPDDSDGEAGAGYLWDAAMRAGLSFRNYGFFVNIDVYDLHQGQTGAITLIDDPHAAGTVVAYPTKPELMSVTDPYFRGFDLKYPDFWREHEWKREFDAYVANKNLPTLELVRLMHDHLGLFDQATDDVNTVETEMADNDYAIGEVIDAVAKSPYRDDTLIFIVEDDAQNGPDHVDAHRTVAFVAGAYVRQGAVVSERYATVNMLRTIEEVLGLAPLGLNDAAVEPMNAVFERTLRPWGYDARVPQVLRTTKLPLPAAAPGAKADSRAERYATPRHDATYWAEKTRGMDFSDADKLDTDRFNHILWEGMKGPSVPFPSNLPKGASGDSDDPD